MILALSIKLKVSQIMNKIKKITKLIMNKVKRIKSIFKIIKWTLINLSSHLRQTIILSASIMSISMGSQINPWRKRKLSKI